MKSLSWFFYGDISNGLLKSSFSSIVLFSKLTHLHVKLSFEILKLSTSWCQLLWGVIHMSIRVELRIYEELYEVFIFLLNSILTSPSADIDSIHPLSYRLCWFGFGSWMIFKLSYWISYSWLLHLIHMDSWYPKLMSLLTSRTHGLGNS